VATETVTADRHELMSRIDRLGGRLLQLQQERLFRQRQRLSELARRLRAQHPQRQLAGMRRQLAFAGSSLVLAMNNQLRRQRSALRYHGQGLMHQHPQRHIARQRLELDHRVQQLLQNARQGLERQQQRLQLQARALDSLSPLKTLGRGFAAVEKRGRLIHAAADLEADDEVTLRFSDGRRQARIRG